MSDALEDPENLVEVWIEPQLWSRENITVLTQNALCLAVMPKGELQRAKGRLEKGEEVRTVLGTAARVIPLADLQAVRVSNKDATMSLGYMDGDRRAQHTIQYCQPQQRKVFAALSEQLGPQWGEETTPSTVWSAVSLPALLTGFLLFLMFLGFMAARQQESGFVSKSARGQAGGAVAAMVGPLGFAILGSLVLAGGIIWAVFAVLSRPAAAVTLTRRESQRSPED
jgi:hypothetical protein